MLYARSLYWICLLMVIAGGGLGVRAETIPLRASAVRVDVFLTTADKLPAVARTILMREAESIWQRHGVQIHWLEPADASPPGPYRMRALIVPKRSIPPARGAEFAIAELVSSAGNHPTAFVSIEAAQRLVDETRGGLGSGVTVFDDRRLGVTLGRALAHEIGHFLLRTKTHARTGLMRSQFNAAEFTDLREGTFGLDRVAEAWLRTRAEDNFAY